MTSQKSITLTVTDTTATLTGAIRATADYIAPEGVGMDCWCPNLCEALAGEAMAQVAEDLYDFAKAGGGNRTYVLDDGLGMWVEPTELVSYIDDTGETRTVEVNPSEARAAAVSRLGAERVDDGTWRYDAAETWCVYEVTDDDMVTLGASIIDGRDAYSMWCADCGQLVEP